MEESQLMEPLQLAGRIIMENGGETFRAEDTVLYIGRALGLDQVGCFAVPSGLFISFRKQDGTTESTVTRIHRGGSNMLRVNEVNAISRELSAGTLTAQQATERLHRAETLTDPLCIRHQIPAAAVCGGGFAVMFGGSWKEMLTALVVCGLVQFLSSRIEKHHVQTLVATLVGAFVAALLPALANLYLFPLYVDATVAGVLMPLLPGLAMTNAVQDAMRGDMVSGMSHALSALLTAGMIACGALASGVIVTLLSGGGL